MGNDNQLAQGCGCLWYAVMGIAGAFALHPIVGVIAIIVVVCIWVNMEKEESSYNRSSSTTTYSSTSKSTNQAKSILVPPKMVLPSKPERPIIPPTIELIDPVKTVKSHPKKSDACTPSRLLITQNLSPAKKINHESFRRELLGHGITCFYHFTDVSNLENIRKYGGLISWSSCETHDVEIPSAGGSDFSRRLDMRYNLQDYVRLSFCDDHPMAYRLKQEGKTLVLLKIRIDVAEWEGTLFSNINATDVGHSHGGSLSDLQKIRWSAVKRNYVSREDEDFKYHQAEILVKTAIPKEFIVNLDNPIYL